MYISICTCHYVLYLASHYRLVTILRSITYELRKNVPRDELLDAEMLEKILVLCNLVRTQVQRLIKFENKNEEQK